MVDQLFLSWWGGPGADDERSDSSDPAMSPGQLTASVPANGLHKCQGKPSHGPPTFSIVKALYNTPHA